MKKEVLRMKDIYYQEDSAEIVKNFHLNMLEDEVVGIVGNNYVGKSSMMGALTGEFPCTDGEIWIHEKQIKINSIFNARQNGVFLLKDVCSLIEEFTIEDTMKLNFALKKKIKYREYRERCNRILNNFDLYKDKKKKICELSYEKKILIEIAVALACEAKIIVFDGVLGLMSNMERKNMNSLIKILKKKGIGIILIESEFRDLGEYIDKLYVIRNGHVTAEVNSEEFDDNLISSLIEGKNQSDNDTVLKKQCGNFNESIFEINKLQRNSKKGERIYINLFKGEVLGILNNSRKDNEWILETLLGKGYERTERYTIYGENYKNSSEEELYKKGILAVIQDPMLYTNMSLEENIMISCLGKNAYGSLFINRGELRYKAQSLWGEYYVKNDVSKMFYDIFWENTLNQKKIMLCRAVANEIGIIIYNSPFLKMDVNEKIEFSKDILHTQEKGVSQIVISSRADHLEMVCDRIITIDSN